MTQFFVVRPVSVVVTPKSTTGASTETGEASPGSGTTAAASPAGPLREPLWRHLLGKAIRDRRNARTETLDDVAQRAGISPQYLSEIERGRKEPSSEIIAAVSGALETSLLELTSDVARSLSGTARSTPAVGLSQAVCTLAA